MPASLRAAMIRRCAANGAAGLSTMTASAKATAVLRAGSSSPTRSGSTAIMSSPWRGLLPATRFAVDAYVHFVRERSLLEAVASSLTELFSPQIIGERVEGMLRGYDFVSADALAYFSKRPPLAQRDSTSRSITSSATPARRRRSSAVLAALEFKCAVLWAMLDALYHAYVAPKHVPPGAFVPKRVKEE